MRQSVRQLIIFKNCSNLLEVFQVILKALLGIVIPNQYYQGAMAGNNFGQKSPNLHNS